jgi:hypothetical protein
MEKPMNDTPSTSPWSAPAAELLQSHCRQIEAYSQPVDAPEDTPAAIRAKASKAPLTLADLPAVMRSLVERYEASHPGTRLEPLRYVSIGSADAGTATTDDPLDGDVVSLSITEAIVDADQIQVESRSLIARRTAARPTKAHRG